MYDWYVEAKADANELDVVMEQCYESHDLVVSQVKSRTLAAVVLLSILLSGFPVGTILRRLRSGFVAECS